MLLPWIIAGISIVVLVSLVIFIRRRKERRELEYYHYKLYGRWERYSIEQLEEELLRIGRKKKELERRLDIFSKAAAKIIMGDEDQFLDQSRDEMYMINLELKQLDMEEDGISQVLRNKKAKQQRV